MNELYIALPHIIALTSLFIAMICLIIATAGKRQSDLFFALIGTMVMVFFVLRPHGIGSVDAEGILSLVLFKRILFVGYTLYAAWFLSKVITVSTSKVIVCAAILVACCVCIMVATNEY